MSVFKIQKIRSCTQCGVVLAQKCKGCVSHPDRKPTIVEYFSWPEILQVCPCKCSVMVRCQRDGCSQTMWRNKTHNSNGLSRSASLYCSKRCNLITLNAAKDTRVEVPCGWCAKPVRRRAAQVKTFQAAYCRPDHYQMAMAKKRHEASEASRLAKDGSDGRSMLQCSGAKCRGAVTEHSAVTQSSARCQPCGTVRKFQATAGTL